MTKQTQFRPGFTDVTFTCYIIAGENFVVDTLFCSSHDLAVSPKIVENAENDEGNYRTSC